MKSDLEQQLLDYGTTIDTATADDLAHRDARLVDTTVERVAPHSRRPVAVLALLAVAGIAAVGIVAVVHRSGATTSSTGPAPRACASGPPNQRRLCKIRRAREYRPHYSNLGSGTDGLPTPAQQKRLATQLGEYNQVEVQTMIRQAKAHGQTPTDQAMVSALEFRNACRVLLVAATAAESLPADQVASAVNPIMDREITRLENRTTAGDESHQLFEKYTRQIDAGHARAVRQAIGTNACVVLTLLRS